MTFGYIYKIVFPNGKHYIGLTTTSLGERQKQHRTRAKSGDTKCLYNALRKYDMVDTLELIEIDTAYTLEELCEKEIGYIINYNSYYMNKNGYNMTYGGEGTVGYIHTEENNQKNRERRIKYYEENPEARQKISEIIKKHFENPEARLKNSEAQKKRFENPEEIQKNREAQIKRFDDPEARLKNSEAQKKRYENPEQRKAHSERMKTLFENPEAIKKCSEAQKKRFENPEERQKMSEMKKKQFEDNPEIQTKRLDAMGKNKQFDVFKDGAFIKTFTYQFQAKEYLQKQYEISSNIKISEVLAGRQKNSAGFVFKYK
jgi:hypothetical protein